MSGGTFDMGYWDLIGLSEDIENWVSANRADIPPSIRQRMLNLAAEAKTMAVKLKAIDYYCAGDYGDDSFNQAWVKAQGESHE